MTHARFSGHRRRLQTVVCLRGPQRFKRDQIVSTKTFCKEQITTVLQTVEVGASAVDTCRKHGIIEATCHRWKRRCEGLGLAELRRLKHLGEGNKKSNQMVADLSWIRPYLN